MMIKENLSELSSTLPNNVTLVAVSKFHPIEAIQEAYDSGIRDFGESRVQELLIKQAKLPSDIRWHFIGHLQTNKVKQILPFVYLIQSVDSVHLMETIEREAAKLDRIINILLEVHVAKDVTKSGFLPNELNTLPAFPHIRVMGIMGMATLTDDETEISRCFKELRTIRDKMHLPILSMGMSDDYRIALREGSTMVRIGSTIFGPRQY